MGVMPPRGTGAPLQEDQVPSVPLQRLERERAVARADPMEMFTSLTRSRAWENIELAAFNA